MVTPLRLTSRFTHAPKNIKPGWVDAFAQRAKSGPRSPASSALSLKGAGAKLPGTGSIPRLVQAFKKATADARKATANQYLAGVFIAHSLVTDVSDAAA